MEIQPLVFGHQLLGDSHMVNLAMMLGNHFDWIKQESIGLCVSGQTIPELIRRLRCTTVIHDRVMLMIGNNDFQRDIDGDLIWVHFLDLVSLLLTRIRKLVILTLVPSPEFIDEEAYRLRCMGFNRWLLTVNWWKIMQLENPERLKVVDVSSPFLNHLYGIREEYFEPVNEYTITGPDGLHLNNDGLRILIDILVRNSHPTY